MSMFYLQRSVANTARVHVMLQVSESSWTVYLHWRILNTDTDYNYGSNLTL
jgi:hypothetical protein